MEGTLDKLAHLYRSPDLRTIGIELDVPKGLVVQEARGAVQAAGMRAGDRITALNGTPVWTFGDFQYYYDKVDRRAGQIRIAVDRAGKPLDLVVTLPPRWWLTDLGFRQSTIDPRVYFQSEPLTEAEKRERGLRPDGFASRVRFVDDTAALLKSHELRAGDIIVAVDGAERDDIANTPELYIKLRKTAGQTVQVNLIRDGKRMQMPVRTFRMSFRK